MVPEDIATVRLAGDVQLSPDGRVVAFVVEEPPRALRPGVARRSGVWLVDADGTGQPRRVIVRANDSTSGSASPRWSPDGRSLALISDHDGTSQVYVLPANGAGAVRRLTWAPEGVDRYAWSPDGSIIAFTAEDPPPPERRMRAERSTATVVGRDAAYTRLWTVGVRSGDTVATLVTRDSLHVENFTWSPDGNAFAVIAHATPLPEDRERIGLVTVERSTGRVVRRLADHISLTNLLTWSPDGRWIAFMESPAESGYAFWLAVVSPDGGSTRPLLKEDTLSVLAAAWMPDSRRVLLEIVEGTHMTLSSVDVVSGMRRPVAAVTASQGDFGFTTNGRRIAYLGQTVTSPPEVWLAELDGTTRRLTNLNPQTAQWRLGAVREVTWRNSRDGLLVRGVLVTPPDYVPGRRYPTIVQCHQGDLPWYVGWLGRWWSWGQLLASNGYVVFLPNYRGVSGQGYRLHMTLGDWGAGLQDLLDGVDSLVHQGIADSTALGIGGWSNGGFITEWTVTHTTRFKAAVAQAGHSDFFSLAGMTGGYRMFGDLYERRAVYDAHSPITFIREARTPTLILHGARDGGVPVGQGYEFYNGLKAMNIEAEMVVYENEGHGIGTPANQVDVNRRVLEWFDRHLRPARGPGQQPR
jgi:dipeptidyl aminopeptidase/acylaminoacyl peptidase